jgi:hypothetical protein
VKERNHLVDQEIDGGQFFKKYNWGWIHLAQGKCPVAGSH